MKIKEKLMNIKNKISKHRKNKKEIKESKILKNLHVYIFCNNKQIKEYDILATKKFNVEDETYVIKNDCCYFKTIDNVLREVIFYVEGNPNPFKLEDKKENYGLSSDELDNYIAGDIFNIIIECQEENDKSKYVFNIALIVLALGIIDFISMVVF